MSRFNTLMAFAVGGLTASLAASCETHITEIETVTDTVTVSDVTWVGGQVRFANQVLNSEVQNRINGGWSCELVMTMPYFLPMSTLEAKADTAMLQKRLASMVHVSELLATYRRPADLYGPVLDTLLQLFSQTDRAFLMIGDRVESLEARAIRQRGNGVAHELSVSRAICSAALERREERLDNFLCCAFGRGVGGRCGGGW